MGPRLNGTTEITLTFFQRLLDEWTHSGTTYEIETVLNAAGVSRDQVERGDPALQLRSYYRALQLAAPQVVDDGFFLRLGRSYDLFDLGILGYALYSAANLRRSWDISLGESGGLVPHPIRTGRRVTATHAGIMLYPPRSRDAARTALCEEWLAGTWRWTCQRLPDLENCREMEVHLDYPAPRYRSVYDDVFPGTVRFNMPETALLIPLGFYERPFSSANPSIARLCYQKSVSTMASFERNDSFVDEVRFYLLQNARLPFPTIADTAAHFHLPVHTLHRRLAQRGTSFRYITLEVRMVLARQYLRETRLPVQEVSYLAGYHHTASFVRAFRDWHGTTPGVYRRGSPAAGADAST